jgi:hypothetical protein
LTRQVPLPERTIARRSGPAIDAVAINERERARLWNRRRADPRLDTVRALTRVLRGFAIRAVPRAHNQPAHGLARAAMMGAPSPAGC